MSAVSSCRSRSGFTCSPHKGSTVHLLLSRPCSGFATEPVRALVTDVEMPGSLDGFTLARVVKQAWPQIGIVVTSGRMAPGPNDLPSGALFIPKPYKALVSAVRTVLSPDETTIPAEAPVPMLPSAIKISQPHTGIGAAGGLAQPLPEPEE